MQLFLCNVFFLNLFIVVKFKITICEILWISCSMRPIFCWRFIKGCIKSRVQISHQCDMNFHSSHINLALTRQLWSCRVYGKLEDVVTHNSTELIHRLRFSFDNSLLRSSEGCYNLLNRKLLDYYPWKRKRISPFR